MNRWIMNSQKNDTKPIPMNRTEIMALNHVVSENPGGAWANSSGNIKGINIPTLMNVSPISAAINSVLYFPKL
ncbi:MAG: hypothetical protein ACTSPG_02545 [Candidatus Hodarchaeales archaeon]